MCGIIGYVGPQRAIDILLDGLKRLEYRGYDSAGVAVAQNGLVQIGKSRGRIERLEAIINRDKFTGTCGVGHTRWATHGAPSDINAHPHADCTGRLALIHNGIIENYAKLRAELRREGHRFNSETDTEVIAHLIEKYSTGNPPRRDTLFKRKAELAARKPKASLLAAVKKALKRLEGAYAICVVDAAGSEIIVSRNQSPLIIGLGKGENFVASDVPAILNRTKKVIYLNPCEVARITSDSVELFDRNGRRLTPRIHKVDWDIESAEKGGYPHFMLKEIFEQPKSLASTLSGRIVIGKTPGLTRVEFSDFELDPVRVKKIRKVFFIGMGTAYHACLVGKLIFEDLTRITTEAIHAAEFRYGWPVLDSSSLVVAVTQSGETADTLAGLRLARSKGALAVTIANVVGSSIPRESHAALYMRCGPEIGVASTKAYTSMLASTYLLAMYIARMRGAQGAQRRVKLLKSLKRIPRQVEKILSAADDIKKTAAKFKKYRNFMFIGRRHNYPTALEGALKLKEISYIHAEGYSAAEMKHGPIAMIDKDFPTVAVNPKGTMYHKVLSNIQEIKARQGVILTVATEGDREAPVYSDYVMTIPPIDEELTCITSIIPLQLFAYYIAALNGKDVDKPRNLAKSVTVE